MAYSRLFLPLKQGCNEYTKDIRGCIGRCIIECRNGVSRLLLQVQGLKSDCDYRVCILSKDSYAEATAPLYVDRRGNGEIKWEFTPEKAGIPISQIKACAVLVKDKAPLIGFVDGEYNWQNCLMAKDINTENSVKPNPEINIIHPEKEKLICIINELNEDINEIKEYSKLGHESSPEALFSKENIHPFGDDGITWVKGNIKELCLIKELWKYINNPFVIKGCRDYKHLIFGRDKSDGYWLGVPCVYDSDYKLEAMFQGFSEFKAENNKQLNNNDFCYCLLKC